MSLLSLFQQRGEKRPAPTPSFQTKKIATELFLLKAPSSLLSSSFPIPTEYVPVKEKIGDDINVVKTSPPAVNHVAIPVASDGTYFSTRCNFFETLYRESYEKTMKKKMIRSRLDLSTDPLRDKAHSDGDMRLRNLNHLLNNMGPGIARSPDQVLFHETFTRACLPKIYDTDWEPNCVRVMEEMKIEKLEYEVLVVTPRRWGKTWSVAMFVLALALAKPGIQIAIFSTGKRASGSLIRTMKAFMKNIPGAEERIVKDKEEELFIAANVVGGGSHSSAAKKAQTSTTTSKIFSYPSSVAGKYYSFLS